MRILALVFSFCAGAAPLFAEINNVEAPGNLAPTTDPGCIGVPEVGRNLSPADLALGFMACVEGQDFDAAVRLYIVIGVNVAFDAMRVSDKSAHGAGQAINYEIGNALFPEQLDKLAQAFERFGGNESRSHSAMCKILLDAGPPTYVPTYMVQHGMGAFINPEDDGLVDGFDAKFAWRDALSGYFNCSV